MIIIELSKKDKEKSWFALFCERMTWSKAGVILTGLSLLAAIIFFSIPYYIEWKNRPTEAEMLKAEMQELIKTIRSTFKPNAILVNHDLYGEVAIIKNFQIKAIEYATLVEAIHNSKPIEQICTDSTNLQSWIKTFYVQNHQAFVLKSQIISYQSQIIDIAKRYNIEEYKSFDFSKDKDIIDSSREKEEVLKELINELSYSIENKSPAKGIKAVASFQKDKRFIKLDVMILREILNWNDVYSIRLQILNLPQ